jgi:predicted aminopeptidase
MTVAQRVLVCAVGAWAWLLAGCASAPGGAPGLGYHWQAVTGHLALVQAARPVDDWLADPATSLALKERLTLAQRMRRFAVTDLALPDNASYTRYADLKRRAAVWNVVAAPEYSLTLHTWCYPVLGCAGYRGYFNEADAEAFAAHLRAQGLEAAAYPVPAYSTLGWTNWLGGDPLLNTFVGHTEGELARLMFHELAHQVVYASDDTVFNESFATAVERLGGQRWLATHASPAARLAYAEFDGRRQQFRELTRRTRENLRQIYAPALDGIGFEAIEKSDQMADRKHAAMAEFRQRYADLKASWGGYNGYDAWVARANNATFGVQAAYDELVPAFEALFVRHGCRFPAFYDAVQTLAVQPAQARHQALRQHLLAASSPATHPHTCHG